MGIVGNGILLEIVFQLAMTFGWNPSLKRVFLIASVYKSETILVFCIRDCVKAVFNYSILNTKTINLPEIAHSNFAGGWRSNFRED